MIKTIKTVINVVRWQRLRSDIADKKYLVGLSGLKKLHLPNGPKQVAIVHSANCLYHLGRLTEAKEVYAEATLSEENWNKRQPSEDSEYLKRYSEFFSKLIDFQSGTQQSETVMAAFNRLVALRASEEFSEILLPLPNRSEVADWLKQT